MASSNPLPDSDELKARNWLDLPGEVTLAILQKLDAVDILTSIQWVCTQWWKICKDPLMWRTINLRWLGRSDVLMLEKFQSLCRHAIDLSCGQLVDITLVKSPTDSLLLYIADTNDVMCYGECHLQRLRLVHSSRVTDKGLIEVAKKLPWLEELDISFCRKIYKDAVEAIGQCCPLLTSFNFSKDEFGPPDTIYCDEDAFAIAKTMPGLRHLGLFGNDISDIGLIAILDGCSHLKSLDLRECFNINFGASLRRRCAEQIKDLRYPEDSVRDIPFYYDFDDDDSSMDLYPYDDEFDYVGDFEDIYNPW